MTEKATAVSLAIDELRFSNSLERAFQEVDCLCKSLQFNPMNPPLARDGEEQLKVYSTLNGLKVTLSYIIDNSTREDCVLKFNTFSHQSDVCLLHGPYYLQILSLVNSEWSSVTVKATSNYITRDNNCFTKRLLVDIKHIPSRELFGYASYYPGIIHHLDKIIESEGVWTGRTPRIVHSFLEKFLVRKITKGVLKARHLSRLVRDNRYCLSDFLIALLSNSISPEHSSKAMKDYDPNSLASFLLRYIPLGSNNYMLDVVLPSNISNITSILQKEDSGFPYRSLSALAFLFLGQIIGVLDIEIDKLKKLCGRYYDEIVKVIITHLDFYKALRTGKKPKGLSILYTLPSDTPEDFIAPEVNTHNYKRSVKHVEGENFFPDSIHVSSRVRESEPLSSFEDYAWGESVDFIHSLEGILSRDAHLDFYETTREALKAIENRFLQVSPLKSEFASEPASYKLDEAVYVKALKSNVTAVNRMMSVLSK